MNFTYFPKHSPKEGYLFIVDMTDEQNITLLRDTLQAFAQRRDMNFTREDVHQVLSIAHARLMGAHP